MRLYSIDRLNLTLLPGVLAIFGLNFWGLNFWSQTRPSPLTPVSANTVNEISVTRQGKLHLDLLRDADGWMITHPEIARARPERVVQLLGILHTTSYRSWPVDTALLARTGLNSPAGTINFDELQIAVGNASTPPGQRYVRVGNRIHLIDELWFNILGLPARHFRKDEQ